MAASAPVAPEMVTGSLTLKVCASTVVACAMCAMGAPVGAMLMRRKPMSLPVVSEKGLTV
jgi:hypothetical protein